MSYEDRDQVNWWKVVGIGMIIVVVLFGCGMISSAMGWVNWFASGTSQVVQQEFSPQELLTKYDWLKSAHAQLEAKKATIEANQGKIKDMEKQYVGVPRNQWAMTDASQYNQWLTENDDLKASFNTLAADYNTRMAEVHWRFTNVGQLPAGSTEPLPREYVQYADQ